GRNEFVEVSIEREGSRELPGDVVNETEMFGDELLACGRVGSVERGLPGCLCAHGAHVLQGTWRRPEVGPAGESSSIRIPATSCIAAAAGEPAAASWTDIPAATPARRHASSGRDPANATSRPRK